MTTGLLSAHISRRKRKKDLIKQSEQYYKKYKEEVLKKQAEHIKYKKQRVKEIRDKFCKMKSTKELCELIKILFPIKE